MSEANLEPAVSEANIEAGVSEEASEPVLRVSAGTPTDEELVAVLVALQSLGGSADEAPAPVAPSRWADRSRGVRATLRPGPGAWVASARPG